MNTDFSACTGFLGFGQDDGGTYSLTCNQRESCRRYRLGLRAMTTVGQYQSWIEPAITDSGCELFVEVAA